MITNSIFPSFRQPTIVRLICIRRLMGLIISKGRSSPTMVSKDPIPRQVSKMILVSSVSCVSNGSGRFSNGDRQIILRGATILPGLRVRIKYMLSSRYYIVGLTSDYSGGYSPRVLLDPTSLGGSRFNASSLATERGLSASYLDRSKAS